MFKKYIEEGGKTMKRKVLINAKVLQEMLQSLEEWRVENGLTSGEFEFLLKSELNVVVAINQKIMNGQMEEMEERIIEPDVKKFVS